MRIRPFFELYNEACSLYHDGGVKRALKLFTQLGLRKDLTAEQVLDSRIWQASCYTKIGNPQKAIQEYRSILRKKLLTSNQRLRIYEGYAVALEKLEKYPQALKMYAQASQFVTNYDDIEHLEWLIEDAIRNFEAFKRFGTLSQWKKNTVLRLTDLLKSA